MSLGRVQDNTDPLHDYEAGKLALDHRVPDSLASAPTISRGLQQLPPLLLERSPGCGARGKLGSICGCALTAQGCGCR